jgi:RNA polymerase sigma factor (sigma-70 family)
MSQAPLNLVLRHLQRAAVQPTAGPTQDGQLLERFTARRDESAFAELVRRHGGMVWKVCHGILHHHQDAEDVFQAAFLVLARKAAAIRQSGSVGGWLQQVAYRLALKAQADTSRRRVRERKVLDMQSADPLLDLTVRELQQILHQELQELPDKYRTPLVLCYLEGQTQDEAAHQLGWSKWRLKGRLERGRERLRRRLARRGLSLSGAVVATVLAADPAAAAMPATLARATVRAALSFFRGGAAAGGVSAKVASLVEGAGQLLSAGQAKMAGLVVLAVTVITLGAGGLARLLDLPSAVHFPEPPSRPGVQAVSRLHQLPPEFVAAMMRKSARDRKEKGLTPVAVRVVDSRDKAVAGARLAVLPWRGVSWGGTDISNRLDKVLGRSRSDAAGRCRLTVPPDAAAPAEPYFAGDLRPDPPPPEPYFSGGLLRTGEVLALAAAPGHGLAWQPLSPFAKEAETVIRLPPEQVVRGRLIDIQGQPAAGVKVHVAWLGKRPGGKHRGLWVTDNCRGLAQWPGPVTTDARGRFTLRGLGPDLGVRLEIRDEPFGHQWLEFQTNPKGAAKDVLLTVAPARVVEGRVTYKDTGKPAAGAEIIMYQNVPHLQSSMKKTCRADARGRFRVNPCGEAFFDAWPPDGVPYLSGGEGVPATKEVAPRRIHIALPRGVLVRGRLKEAESGRPVVGARVEFWSLGKFVDLQRPVWSGKDGRFRLVVPARPGHLLIQARGGGYLRREASTGEITKERSTGHRLYPHALVKLELKRGDRSRDVQVALRRGVTLHGRLVGPEGQKVDRAVLLSRLNKASSAWDYSWDSAFPTQVTDGQFELRGGDPRGTYPVFVVDPKHGWGTVARVSFQQAGGKPVLVHLQKCGSVTVRFVDRKGKPVPDISVHGTLEMRPGSYSNVGIKDVLRFLGNPRRTPEGALHADEIPLDWNLRSDARGRITLPALIPGATYRLAWSRDRRDSSGGLKKVTVKPGQALDLGDIRVQP